MPLPYRDLRDFIHVVDQMGELKVVTGVSWDREMGAMTEMVVRRKGHRAPALLFDEIPGYPKGYRCLYAMLNSPRRFCLSLGIPTEGTCETMDLLQAYRERTKDIQPLPPEIVKDGPVLENVIEGEAVDLLKFPVPIHHELDGGRYIGTASGVITRDPDTGWINVGTYRVQVAQKNVALSYISPGKHGQLQRDKYLERGKPCPIAIIVGINPLLYVAARYQVPMGVSELDYAGGIKGEPIRVIEGISGLPIPADSEIVLEGEVLPDEKMLEGPFGEWPGYYAGGEKEEPVIKIKRILHRSDPILTCAGSNKPPHAHLFERCFIRSAALWEGLEKAGVPNICGVWLHEAGAGRTFNVISIKQSYFGHSRHAGMLATQMLPGAYIGRWVIVVDDDIDPSDMYQVLWAMGTRCDPAEDIEITRKCWSSRTDPLTGRDIYYNSRAMVDACIPYERRQDFPKVAETSAELREQMLRKYPSIFEDLLGERV
jgi:4-hydroxy-3-polyprenylbenzoate decarboxylase